MKKTRITDKLIDRVKDSLINEHVGVYYDLSSKQFKIKDLDQYLN